MVKYLYYKSLIVNMQVCPDPYRYVNWVLFFLAAGVNNIPSQAFSGVNPIVQRVYQITELEANMVGLFYSISYVFLLIPANYILDKKGLKIGTLICQVSMIAGLLVRLLIKVNFYFFYLGTILCSLGFCFMLSAANKFANIWFPRGQIFLVSTLCVFAIFSSDAIGYVLSSFLITESSSQEDIFNFFLWEGGVLVFIHLLMALFFRGSPKSPQNYASVSQRNPYMQDLRVLLKTKNYLVLLLAMTFVFSYFEISVVFMPYLTQCFGYESHQNGIFIAISNIMGLVGCVFFGKFGGSSEYKKKAVICSIGLLFSAGLIWIAYQVSILSLNYIGSGLTGFFGYPMLTTLTDFATQTTFPVGEATASGILMFGGQFAGIVLIMIFSFIFDGSSKDLMRVLLGILLLILVLGLVTVVFTKEILKRDDYQNVKEKQSGSLVLQRNCQEKLIIN